MGAVGGLLGVNGGANGTGFAGPSGASIQTPATTAQATQQWQQAQAALKQQQDLLTALQAQNGIQNQSSVFNQLQGVANGTGPNPAQAMLNQQTGTNVANQSALMAGQRGAASNVGLIARQAAQQGAQTQQQAVGQGATMQAQQSLGALQGLGTIAGQQVGQQANATNSLSSAQQAEQANILNAITGQNNSQVSMQGNINNANASLAGITMQGQQNLIGNIMGGGGAASMLAEGGEVSSDTQDTPAQTDITQVPQSQPETSGPNSNVGKFFSDQISSPTQETAFIPSSVSAPAAAMGGGPSTPAIGNAFQSKSSGGGGGGIMSLAALLANGGKVPVMLSKGEKVVKPEDVPKVAAGKKDPIKETKTVPGKPKYKGNDYRNDVVPANLPEGSIVIPNKVLQGKSPHWAAMRFVQTHMAQGGKVGMTQIAFANKHKKVK